MRRRSRASSKLAKTRSRKAKTPNAVRHSVSSVAAQETEAVRFRRERDEALEREIATAEVLKVISSSPGDVKSVFEAILENATRICEAKFGILLTYQNELFHPIAHRNTPPGLLEFLNQRGPFQPPRGTSLDQLLKTNDFVHRADDSVHQTPSSPARLGGAKSHLAVPVFKNRALVGAIMIYRQEVRPFTEKQIDLVKTLPPKPSSPSRTRGCLMNCEHRCSSKRRPQTCCGLSVRHRAILSRCSRQCWKTPLGCARRSSACCIVLTVTLFTFQQKSVPRRST